MYIITFSSAVYFLIYEVRADGYEECNQAFKQDI